MAARLLALAAVLDGLDRRPRIRMRHAPHAAAQRLLDSLGVLVFIDLSAPRCMQRCNQKECRMSTVAIFEPNWISYRHSLVQVDKRRDADDETLEICAHCECEVDVIPAPHKPGCRGIGAPRTNSASAVSGPMVAQPTAPKPPSPLDIEDADEEDDEVELDEAAGPDGEGRLPDPPAAASSPDLATSNGENPYGLQKMGRGYRWPEDVALRAVRDFTSTVGRPPQQQDARDEPTGTLPSLGTAATLFGSWDEMLRVAGISPVQGRPPRTKIRAAASAADKRPADAAAPPRLEPRDDHERDARAVDASPTGPPAGALPSGSGGANLGETRMVVLAAIAAARTFADMLEHELERSDAA